MLVAAVALAVLASTHATIVPSHAHALVQVGPESGSCYTSIRRLDSAAPRLGAEQPAAAADSQEQPDTTLWFSDVAASAGIVAPAGQVRTAPNCLFNAATSPPTVEEMRQARARRAAGDVPASTTPVDTQLANASDSVWSAELLRYAREHSAALRDVGAHGSHDAARGVLASDHGGACFSEKLVPTGMAVGDFDDDGLPDIFYGMYFARAKLFRNVGDGTFEDVAEQSGLWRREVCERVERSPRLRTYQPEDPSGADDDLLCTGSTGAAFADVDNDGDLDLIVATMGKHRHYLFINSDGRGTFVEDAIARGARVTEPGDWTPTAAGSVNIGDIDNDGFLDWHVTEWRPFDHRDVDHWKPGHITNARLMRNRGGDTADGRWAGHFEDVTDSAGAALDRWQVERLWHHMDADRFVFAGSFSLPKKVSERVGRAAGVYALSSLLYDLDGDGWDDLYAISDMGTSVFFWNNGDGSFTESTEAAGVGLEFSGMGSTVADVNNDGLLDVYITGIGPFPSKDPDKPQPVQEFRDAHSPFGPAQHVLYINNGNRTFRNVKMSFNAASWSWGAAFMDFDNDGDVDLLQVNGIEVPETTYEDPWNVAPNHMLVNQGDDPATPANWPDLGSSLGVGDMAQTRGVALFDYDLDGDLDAVTSPGSGVPRLLRNDGAADSSNAWLRVNVKEAPGRRDSIGARVFVTREAGEPGDVPSPTTFSSVIGSKTGFCGHSEPTAHFGLGPLRERDATFTVTVRWTRGAQPQERVVTGVRPNRVLTVYRVTSDSPSSDPGGDGGPGAEAARDCSTVDLPAPARVAAGAPLDGSLRAVEMHASMPRTVHAPGDLPQWVTQVMMRVGTRLVDLQRFAQLPIHAPSGAGNNQAHPEWGSAGKPLSRIAPPAYEDGVSTLRRMGKFRGLPSARAVSNIVFAQAPGESTPCPKNSSDVVVHFGQLLAHDTDHTVPVISTEDSEFEPIAVPKGDPWFDPDGVGGKVIRFKRSIFDHSVANDRQHPRQQLNKVTSFVDASCVYGSDATRMDALRAHTRGLMRTQSDDNAPVVNVAGVANDNPLARKRDDLVLAGDVRSNIQPGLLAMHTLFVREHNALARGIWAMLEASEGGVVAESKLAAADDAVFAAARRFLIAEFQHISYDGYLAQVLPRGPGNKPLLDSVLRYTGYKPTADPTVSQEFATAAFRFGHSQANDGIVMRYKSQQRGQFETEAEVLSLRDAYFKTRELLTGREGGIDPVLRGMVDQPAQAADARAVEGLRSFLFGSVGEGGVDLIATNIQRGRDHGIPDYNTVREAMGLTPRGSIDEISSDPETVARLKRAYVEGIDTIDLLVGGLAEDIMAGGTLGETFSRIVATQFAAIRDGDRFWYESGLGFSANEVRELKSTVTMGSLLLRHLYVPPFSFQGVRFSSTDVFKFVDIGTIEQQFDAMQRAARSAAKDRSAEL